jgi:AraC-like DNA-binding protein
MTLERVPAHWLPDGANWRDEGCEFHSSCLTCPFEVCRYDAPGGIRSLLAEPRNEEIARLRAEGSTVTHVATRFGVSRRSVFRIQKRAGVTVPSPVKLRLKHVNPKRVQVQRLRADGMPTAAIAQRVGLSERHTRRLIGVRQLPSAEEVRQYRAAGHSITATVTHFGVGRTTIMRLQRGRR